MVAASTAAELGTEVRALNLIELADLAPGGVADGSGNIDLEFQRRHNSFKPRAGHPQYGRQDAGALRISYAGTIGTA
jgi:hypothetical protein